MAKNFSANEGILHTIDGFIGLAKRVGPIDAIRIVGKLKSQMNIPVESLATETYWSRAPLRIGNVVVKYLLAPVVEKHTPKATPNNLTEELKTRMRKTEVRFKFQVQRYINKTDTPLEDARKAWQSPIEEIAELVIPVGTEIDNDNDFFETLQFNPWQVVQHAHATQSTELAVL